jgi:hypothetical protein
LTPPKWFQCIGCQRERYDPKRAGRVAFAGLRHITPRPVGVSFTDPAVITAELRLPAIHQFPEEAEESGFVAYGPHVVREVMVRRLAQLLRDTKPSRYPTKCELVITILHQLVQVGEISGTDHLFATLPAR